eukprot:COSAG05_NODE_16507_length_344_cov_1.367347_1_plen_49_part_10
MNSYGQVSGIDADSFANSSSIVVLVKLEVSFAQLMPVGTRIKLLRLIMD